MSLSRRERVYNGYPQLKRFLLHRQCRSAYTTTPRRAGCRRLLDVLISRLPEVSLMEHRSARTHWARHAE